MNIASTGVAHKLGFSEAGITDGLVGWWPLNGNANDLSGNRNNGTVSGATVVSGLNGLCYSFDATDDYISCGNNSTLDMGTGSFTLSAWVYTFATGTTRFILGKTNGNNVSTSIGYSLYLGNTGSMWAMGVWDGTVGNTVLYSSVSPITNTWTHLVASYESISKVASIYVNAGTPNTTVTSITGTTTVSDDLFIGKTTLSNTFNGLIEDARVYNRALSADEVNILYELGNSNSKLKISKNTVFVKGEFNELL